MDQFYKKLGTKIKTIREHLDLSQEKLAKSLHVSRVTLSQIENGERKITAGEIANMAKIFNITTDVLLNLQEEVKVILDETKNVKEKPNQEIRISVPQKNVKKFKEVLLYILNKVGSKPNIGESVIYKLLYFIDFNYYEKYEEQLIGATYIKNNYGPTPKEFIKIVDDMIKKGEIIKIDNKYYKFPQRKYLPRRTPDLSMLTALEIKEIDDVLERFSDMNATEISKYSHEDVPWKTTENGKIIDYESVFYRTMPYSVRSYDNEQNIQRD